MFHLTFVGVLKKKSAMFKDLRQMSKNVIKGRTYLEYIFDMHKVNEDVFFFKIQ